MGKRLCSAQQFNQNWLWTSSLLCSGCWGFLRFRAAGAKFWPLVIFYLDGNQWRFASAPPYAFKSCGGTKFKVKQFWKYHIYGFFKAYFVVVCVFSLFTSCLILSALLPVFVFLLFLLYFVSLFPFCLLGFFIVTRFLAYVLKSSLRHTKYIDWPTNALCFMAVILLHSGHRHVSAGHVATFRVVRTRTQI